MCDEENSKRLQCDLDKLGEMQFNVDICEVISSKTRKTSTCPNEQATTSVDQFISDFQFVPQTLGRFIHNEILMTESPRLPCISCDTMIARESEAT